MADLVGQFGAFDQRFARHAAVVQAVAPHFVGFHQRDLGLDHRADVGRHQPTGTSTNDDQVAVKAFRLLAAPSGHKPCLALETLDHLARHQREQAQQHKRTEQPRAQNAAQRLQLRQLCARVHIHHGAGQHAKLADPVEGQRLHLGQAHHQVDDEEGHQRHQPQREQVERPVFGHAVVDLGQAAAKARFDAVAQDKAGHQKCQRGPARCGERHDQRAPPQAKNGTASEGQNRRTRERQRGGGHVEGKERQRHHQRPARVDGFKAGLALLQVVQAEVMPQVKKEERGHQAHNQRGDDGFLEIHEGISPELLRHRMTVPPPVRLPPGPRLTTRAGSAQQGLGKLTGVEGLEVFEFFTHTDKVHRNRRRTV